MSALVLPYVHEINRQLDADPLPTSFDMRTFGDYPRLTAVKDQAGCGADVAFSAAAALESTLLIQSKGKLARPSDTSFVSTFPDFSEAHMYWCDWDQTCEGGYDLASAAQKIEQWGATHEVCAPYTGARLGNNGCATFCHINPTGGFNVVQLGNSIDAIKKHIYIYGPVQTTFAVFQDFLDWSAGEACPGSAWMGTNVTDPPLGGHAVALIGWEEDGGGNGYWIVRNSWSDAWCEGGYFRIAYGADGIGGTDQTQGFRWNPTPEDCTGMGMVFCKHGCAATEADCSAPPDVCPSGQVHCLEDNSCRTSVFDCPNLGACDTGFLCWNGDCANSLVDCAGPFPLRDECGSLGLFTW